MHVDTPCLAGNAMGADCARCSISDMMTMRRKGMNDVNLKSGVTHYETRYAIVPIHFPDGKIVCSGCRFCRSDEALRRFRCLLTDDILYRPVTETGERCPIRQEVDDEKVSTVAPR